ncbi:MAG TPA: Rrf2 family transcriptional regulator [Methylocystis sp.]|nr:Rrf2 family transcriptional regulator [Methylocystis sp.]
MTLLPRAVRLAVMATLDIGLHARARPVSSKQLAARYDLPPRRLESLLQALVRGGILRSVRGPQGGYELARERRRLTLAKIARAALGAEGESEDLAQIEKALGFVLEDVETGLFERLEQATLDDLAARAIEQGYGERADAGADFAI